MGFTASNGIKTRPVRRMTQAEPDSFLEKAADILRGNVDHSEFRGYVFAGKDDIGRFTAEFDGHALQITGGEFPDPPTDFGRADEEDFADERKRDQSVADGSAGAGEHLEDAGWQTGIMGESPRDRPRPLRRTAVRWRD